MILFRTLSARFLRRRWERAVLVTFSIALGVATLVSTRLLSGAVGFIANDAALPVPGADLVIWGEGGTPASVARDLDDAKVPGVERVMPLIIDRAYWADVNDRPLFLLAAPIGKMLEGGGGDNPFKVTPTVLPISPRMFLLTKVAISRNLYDERQRRGLTADDPMTLRVANNYVTCVPIAVFDFADDSPVKGFASNLVAMELRSAFDAVRLQTPSTAGALLGPAKYLGRPKSIDKLTRIDITLRKGADLAAVQQSLQAIVGERSKVQTPEAAKKSTEEIIDGIQIGFTLTSVGALVVGMFLVYNALSVSVAERRPEIGILRSLGATRFQVAGLFALEAIFLGVVGGLIGIPIGRALATFALNQVKSELESMLLGGALPSLALTWQLAVLALSAGAFTSLCAALIPAWQAASDQPAEVVRRAPSSSARFWTRLHFVLAAGLIVAGPLMVLFRKQLPPRVGGHVGITVLLIGLFVAMPLVIGVMIRLLRPLFALFGIEERLAADNLRRAPGRTGVVIGAMAAGVTLMFQTAGVGMSNRVPIERWLDRVLQADAFIFWGDLASSNNSMAPMQPAVRTRLADIEGVKRVAGLRFSRPEYHGTIVFMVAMDALDYEAGISERSNKGLPELAKFKLLPLGDNVVISTNFAIKWGVKVGDVVEIPKPGGVAKLTVVGVGEDYSWSKGTLFMDRTRYAEVFGDPYVDIYHTFFETPSSPETLAKVQRFAEENSFIAQDHDFIRGYLAGIIDRIYQLAYVQQLVVSVVAALGVITALLISVIQRRRELGLLRAVGATRTQVLRSVISEALLMGLVGVVLGIMMGVPMEWYILKIVLYEESGFLFEPLIPWSEALGIAGIAMLVSLVAGILPALQAMRLKITEAIAYE